MQRYPATTVNRWDIRDGMFYQDDDAFKIVKLTKREFDYASTKNIGVWANGKFILTAPAGTVFRLSPNYPSNSRKILGKRRIKF